ncbi:MAG: DNA repair protein RecN [Oscillospiraceae bacterium]|nr:DNA repair protein RecN [Oscillospiraceae bacterium]
MLSELYIQNIAVIEKASVTFSKGLNIFTGETGAGKSILIDAINAVLGSRTSKDLVRTGEKKALVTALFQDLGAASREMLTSLGYEPEEDGSLLMMREIASDGKTSCKLNGRPATAAILKEVAQNLITIHGQHDNQALLSPEKHLGFIDDFGGTATLLEEYRGEYAALQDLRRELERLTMDDMEKSRRIDLLSYQVDEISAAELFAGEEEQLRARKKIIANAARILENLHCAHDILFGGDNAEGVVAQMEELGGNLEFASGYYPELGEISARVQEMRYELEEDAEEVRSLLDEVEVDPGELNRIEARLDLIYQLKRKYGSSEEEILEYFAKAQEELDSISRSDELADKLRHELSLVEKKTEILAKNLSERRQTAIEAFAGRVGEELRFLDMPAVRFVVDRQDTELTARGMDRVEFLISTNPGEPPKPIGRIASGGELSRIMLSLKNVIADSDQVDTLIFDEVDAGVSGRAADRVGQKLKEVSRGRQIICVTHLAQVAAFADNHLLIEKTVSEGRTFTGVQALDRAGRVSELARIMGGEAQTPAVLQSAGEMLSRAASIGQGKK